MSADAERPATALASRNMPAANATVMARLIASGGIVVEGRCSFQYIARRSAANPYVNGFSRMTQPRPPTVSYTHLTLPTIYSV